MKRILLLSFAATLTLFAYSDMDMDGVDDSVDKCPNTPITDIVDANGCSIKSVITENHFDLILGLAYSQYNYRLNDESDTWTTTAQVDYYRNDFSMQLSTSWYRTDSGDYDDSGMNDTTLAAYYRFNQMAWAPNLTVQLGAGVIFPTYNAQFDNNNADYMGVVNLNYDIDKTTLFGSYSYTYIGDDDVSYTDAAGNPQRIEYQNVNAYSLGAGYHFTPTFYASASYYRSDSIYKSVEDIESLSLYGFYSIDAHWFLTGSYAYGLSDSTSDHYAALRLGYYF
ncbi:DUF3187 domain-containing protein [Hydrogenimonas sp. SS33]|uniref:DUF3187 domain-containing protein n=1 Tax=Hydrogenimonas leucolamina TaxID=2954236 RepID=UPI00336C10AF